MNNLKKTSTATMATTIQYGGKFITSTGVLRVLVVYIRFARDNETSPRWPDPNVLPEWAQHIVDNTYSPTGNYYAGTVSNYFYVNSYGQFHVIGDVYYVTTDNTEDYYHQYASSTSPEAARGLIEMEVLNKLDNPPYNVDFNNYDNWKKLGDFNNPAGKDYKLDMCWFITRNLHKDDSPNHASFDIGHAVLDCASHERDGVTIDAGDGNSYSGSSGICIFADQMNKPIYCNDQLAGKYSNVNVIAHEMSHHFFGAYHFAVDGPENIGLRTYVGGWASTYSGYEKWRLGWLQPTTITANGDNYSLSDIVTTTDNTKARLYKINIPETEQFFLIENRQWINPFFEPHYVINGGPTCLLIPGILIYHIIQENDFFAYTDVKKVNANGRYIWKMLYHGSDGDWQGDVIDKDHADRENGFSESDMININDYPFLSWKAEWHPNTKTPYGGGPYMNSYSQGGVYETGVEDNISHIYQVGDVLTPWSNTASHQWNGNSFSPSTIGLQVMSYNLTDGSYTLAIRLTNPEDIAPSKPQDVHASYINQNTIIVSWIGNIDPHMIQTGNHHYDIYRSLYYDGCTPSYDKINTTTSTSFTDNPPDIPPGIPSDKDVYWSYDVKAIDNTGKFSIASEDARVFIGVSTPEATSATQITSMSFIANWKVAKGAQMYYLDVATDSNFTSYVDMYHEKKIVTGISYSVTGLTPNTHYYYRVLSYNGISIAHSNTIDVTTLVSVSVSGKVTYANTAADAIGDVYLLLSPKKSTSTTVSGTYIIPDVSTGTYTLTAEKAYNFIWGGVNATDALLVARHSAGIAILTGLASKAGDVDNNGAVNNIDASMIIQRYVGLRYNFPVNEWVFTSQQVAVGATNVTADISGLEVGDVNASYTLASGAAFQKSSIINLKSGVDKFAISASSSAALGAVSIKIDVKSARVIGISSKLPNFVSRMEDASVSFGWFAQDGKTPAQFESNEAIVTISIVENPGERSRVTIESELVDITGVAVNNDFAVSVEKGIPTSFALEQNYPNPFNATTVICYQLPVTSHVSLKVYDVLSREVVALVEDTKQAQYYEATFNASHLSSGIYFVRFLATPQNGNQPITKTMKMLLLK